MKKITKRFDFLLGLILNILTVVLGVSGNVVMANTAALEGGGVTSSGSPGTVGAIATETGGRENGDPEFYSKEIDRKIVKIRPASTPIETISRHADARPSVSFEVKYYSLDTRPMVTTVKEQLQKQSSGTQTVLKVQDPTIFNVDDTIKVVGVKGITDHTGKAFAQEDARTPDLVLCVCGENQEDGMPIVYAVNGHDDGKGNPIWLPMIKQDTVLIRMGKACGELDMQTGGFNNLPTAEVQYLQNFMMQVEQSTFDKIAGKEVDWEFSDIEEDGIYDMKRAMELSFLFGSKACIKHTSKKNMATWFTGGIWSMAGKDIQVGTYDKNKKTVVVSDDDLVDISKSVHVGNGTGEKRKIWIVGSEMLSSLSKIQSDKFRLKESVEYWNIKFKGFETEFGEVLVIHHELFDQCRMEDKGFSLDPTFLTKYTHKSWARNVLDLKTAGIRNTEAVVIQEVCGLVLRNPKAHARLFLPKAAA